MHDPTTHPLDVAPITALKNLGPKSAAWLRAIGVHTLADLDRLGPLPCFARLRAEGYPATLNLVYAMEGALRGLDWRALPPQRREELRLAVNALKGQAEQDAGRRNG